MTSTLDKILPTIVDANDAGLTYAAIRVKVLGKSIKAKHREAELRQRLAVLVREGAIWGPLKHGVAQYYFAAGRGPSIETASDLVARLVSQSGVKLLSRSGLEKKVTGMNRRFFGDAIKHAVATRQIVELSCGTSKYYLHRDVAAEHFDLEASRGDDASGPPEPPAHSDQTLDFEHLLPAYRRLKSEQGGFSAVKISDLMKTLGVSKKVLHPLLLAEAKTGRLTLHHTTSVELPAEVVDAGIRLPGFPEPFVTVVVKNDP
jgi:hypothetical protein